MLKVKKMKNIIFKIKTKYSLETYFLVVNENKLIETQIDDALASIGYCDAYEIENYKEVSKKYAARRNKFLKKYKKLFQESVEDAFPSGKLTSIGAIKADISWRKSQIKEKNYEIHGN